MTTPGTNSRSRLRTSARFSNVHRESRAAGAGDALPLIVGYAAVFFREDDPATEYEIWPGFVERISPTAFDRAIRERDDARGLFNHDASKILGRTESGTLQLSVDSEGLRYEIDPPDTTYARDLITALDRGDVTGSSFSFNVRRSTWIEEEERDIRVIEDLQLWDVGPVTFPAYESTTSESQRMHGQDHRDWLIWKRQRESDMVTVRLREIELDEPLGAQL